MNATAKLVPNQSAAVERQRQSKAAEVQCIAVLWARGASQNNVKHEILRDLMQTNGILRAVFSTEKLELLVVDYDSRHIRAAAILETVNRPGVRARIVGC